VLKFQVRENELLTRLTRRARADDTDELIRHRFNVYREQTAPLMRYYRKEFITIDGVGAIDRVFTPGATSLQRLPPIRHQKGVIPERDLL
jgi:adenylate kinase